MKVNWKMNELDKLIEVQLPKEINDQGYRIQLQFTKKPVEAFMRNFIS